VWNQNHKEKEEEKKEGEPKTTLKAKGASAA